MLDLHFCIIVQVGLYTMHDCVCVTGFMQSRKNLMAPFCDGETRVLVCTDLASRGIDHDKVWKSLEVLLCIIILVCTCPHHVPSSPSSFHSHSFLFSLTHTSLPSSPLPHVQVTHVVLFDFPNTVVDYLHRVGRTGRVSSAAKCRASILMSHRRDVRAAWQIKVS